MATPSVELQTAIYDALVANAGVAAVVAGRIFDGLPTDYPAISFGPSNVIPDDMDGIAARVEYLQLDCWAEGGKRLRPARELADLVKASLHLKELHLGTHALAKLQVSSVRVFMDPDGLTGHGVVTLEALVEER